MKIKKTVALLAAVMLMLSCALPVFAEGKNPEVYVSISDGSFDNGIELTWEAVKAEDVDNDGVLTLNDALYAAHEAGYEGGAAAGYESGLTEYGISLNRLWGVENGGCYGYYINSQSALSLSDPIKDGDYIYAYAYADLAGWSDMYTCFSQPELEAAEGSTHTLTLSGVTFDAEWNPVTVPVEGARILLNGEDSGVVTDAEGKAKITFDRAGKTVVSAVSDNAVLVPPVCVADVADSGAGADNTAGGTLMIALPIVLAAVLVIAVIVLRRVTKKK